MHAADHNNNRERGGNDKAPLKFCGLIPPGGLNLVREGFFVFLYLIARIFYRLL